MVRFIELLGIFVLFLILTWRVTTCLNYKLDGPSFFYALLIAAITSFSFNTLEFWWGRATRPDRPQTLTHMTSETPKEVIRSAFWPRLALFLTAIVVAIIIVVILRARR